MKKLRALLLAAVFCSSTAHGQMFPGPGTPHNAGGGGGTFSLVNHAIAQSSTSIAVAIAPTDFTLSGGANLLTACVSDYPSGGALGSIIDSSGNTWVNEESVIDGSNATRTTLFIAANATVTNAQTVSYNIGGSGLYPTLSVQGWNGALASPFDVGNTNSTASATTLTTGSVTPGQSNELLVACLGVAYGFNPTISINSSFTMLDQAGSSGTALSAGIGYQIQTTATTRNPQFTISTSAGQMTAVIGTFKP